MDTIDSSILEKGYSVFKSTQTGQYYAMAKEEVERIHRISDGKPYSQLAAIMVVNVFELVEQPDKTIVLLNEEEITVTANSLTPIPIKLI